MAILCKDAFQMYEWLQCMIATLSCGWFASIGKMWLIQDALEQGWKRTAKAKWKRRRRNTWYQRHKPNAGEDGVLSGVTKAVLHLQDYADITVMPDFIKLQGQPMPSAAQDVRRHFCGPNGLRSSTVDNRITPPWKVRFNQSAEGPGVSFPENGGDVSFETAVNQLPLPYSVLKKMRASNGGLHFVAKHGRVVEKG